MGSEIGAAVPSSHIGFQHCAYKIKSQEQAYEILHKLVRSAHMTSIKGGGTLIAARIDMEHTLKLCLWEVECEDCEHSEEMGDGPEPWTDEVLNTAL